MLKRLDDRVSGTYYRHNHCTSILRKRTYVENDTSN